jgi:formylglycine-generating enzyme required for sulfatase activity
MEKVTETRRRDITILVGIVAALLLYGCDVLPGPDEPGEGGNLVISFGGSGSWAAPVDLERYDLVLTGPGQPLKRSVSAWEGFNKQTNLKEWDPAWECFNEQVALGEWHIEAKAYRAGDVLAGTGSTTVTVRTGKNEARIFVQSVSLPGVPPGDMFVAVSGITGVVTAEIVGRNLTLAGTVTPNNATNNVIGWSVKNAGTTGANITGGNILSTTGVGTAVLTAAITDGTGVGTPYIYEFSITIIPPPPAYTMVSVSSGTVTEANTGAGDTTNWGAGNNSAYEKPYTVNTFSIGETEITYELWYSVRTWALGNGYTLINSGSEGHDGTIGAIPTNQKPVTQISWRDAVVWCNAYSKMSGKTPVYYLEGTSDFTDSTKELRESEHYTTAKMGYGKAEHAVINTTANGFCLPTEAEWEYAARGGIPDTTTPWTFSYAGSNTIGDVAVYQSPDNMLQHTFPVKSKTGGLYSGANSLGLYDMSGNVGELCWDEIIIPPYSGYLEYLDGIPFRVQRGGSALSNPYGAVVSEQSRADPSRTSTHVGFRIVCH